MAGRCCRMGSGGGVGGGGGVILPTEIAELQGYGITRIYSPDDGRAMGLQGMINNLLEQADTAASFFPHPRAAPSEARVEAPTLCPVLATAEGCRCPCAEHSASLCSVLREQCTQTVAAAAGAGRILEWWLYLSSGLV